MILNVGCGGRPEDKRIYFGDVRIDVEKFLSVVILMDAHYLGFKESVFEKIVCFEVLEHLDSPIRALKEFKRVLREDGEIIVSLPNVWYWRRIVRPKVKKREVSERLTEAHKQAWDIHEFSSLAYQVGLGVADVKWLDWYPQGRRRLWIIDQILKPFPQVCFTHVVFKLKIENSRNAE